jgi:hypothetical protein
MGFTSSNCSGSHLRKYLANVHRRNSGKIQDRFQKIPTSFSASREFMHSKSEQRYARGSAWKPDLNSGLKLGVQQLYLFIQYDKL